MENPIHFEGASILKSAIQAVSAVSTIEDNSDYPVYFYEFFVIVGGEKVAIKKSSSVGWNYREATEKREEFLQLIGWQ